MRRSPFFLKARGAPNIEAVFPTVNVSQVESTSLVRRAAASASVSQIEADALVRHAGTRVSQIEAVALVRQSTLVNAFGNYSTLVSGARSATANFVVDSDGYLYLTNEFGLLEQREQWLGSGVAGDYEAQITFTSGSGGPSMPLNQYNTWYNCGTDQTWQWGVTGRGKYAEIDVVINIRDTATSTIQESSTILIQLLTDGGVVSS